MSCLRTETSLSSFQDKLSQVKGKFRLFQKPANFDQRLRECERVLEEVKGKLAVLSVRSVEQEVVQSQLEQCMVGHFIGIIYFILLFKAFVQILFYK